MDTRPLSHRKILARDTTRSQEEQTREVMTRLAGRGYRRAASKAEIDGLCRIVESVVAGGEKWEAGVQTAIQAILCSPKFLFRVELDQRPESDEPRPIDEYQLACRLSYFLWSSMPDDELFELAGQGQLTAQLEPQVRRMLQDPKASALVENFAMQWLQLGKLGTLAPDATLFPTFNEPLRQAMITETKLLLQSIIQEDRSVLELLSADYTFVNERLAKHYGIVDSLGNRVGDQPQKRGQPIRGANFVRVPLLGDRHVGLLTHASVLTVTSNPTRTSPVKRGRWILEQILGAPPPPPPPNVPELEQEGKQLTGTLRQRMEQHRANPSCAGCHARMDPIGFAFENFDAIGAFRTKDGEFEIDPSGVLDGQQIAGPDDLKRMLLEKKEAFTRSLAEKMLVYGLGRGLEYYDKVAVDRIVAGAAKNNDRFSHFVIEIVRSDPFRLRRGKEKP